MHETTAYKELLFDYEMLRAKLQIREYFLDNVVKEVYENIGQVLSVVRMQLVTSTHTSNEVFIDRIIELSYHVEQAIHDLRIMAKHFYPDAGIYKEPGWIAVFASTVDILNLEAGLIIQISGEPMEVASGSRFILIRILLEILITIKKQNGKICDFMIVYLKDTLEIAINYQGELILWDNVSETPDGSELVRQTSVRDQVSLLDGSIHTSTMEMGKYSVTLKAPFKSSLQ